MQATEYMLEYTDNLNKEFYGNSMEDMKKAAEQGQAKALHEAKLRKQAEAKSKQAEAKIKQAESKIKQAESKIKQAEVKSKQAEANIAQIVSKLLESGMTMEEIAKTVDLPLNFIKKIATP